MISVESLHVEFGVKPLFTDASFVVNDRDRIALVGKNGAGKSTFLKAISGELEPTKGSVVLGPGERLSVLSQDHFKWDEYTVMDTVMMGHTVLWNIMKQREELYAKTDFTDEDGLKVSELEEKFAELDGWNAESDAASLLSGLGIKEDKHYMLMGELSGKEKVRVMLAQALYGNPDNLLLDEPTNDLDIQTLAVLEDYIAHFKGCVIIVSHDRYFMDRTVDHTWVFMGNGVIKDFPGNYSEYRAWKELHEREVSEKGKNSTSAPERQHYNNRDYSNKLTYKEKKELEQITADLEALNHEKDQLDTLFSSGATIDDAAQKAARYQEIKDTLDELEMRWLELSEKK